MALSIYRRHREGCKFADKPANKIGCRCSLWARGTIEGKSVRESLKTRNWERAEELIREKEGSREKQKRIRLADAIARYQTDCESRNLANATIKKITKLLEALQKFADSKGLNFLEQIGVAELREFRDSWKTWGALTQRKNIERLKAFNSWCADNKWTEKLPRKAIKAPEIEPSKVTVFTDAEIHKIHTTIKNPKMRAFILTLQHTGLRISDAVQLRKQDITDGRLLIRTEKTSADVWLPLPPSLLAALAAIRTTEFYFWTGASKLTTVIGSKRRGVAKLLKRAEVRGNPHKFRHTLATNLLSNGTSPAIVAKILGNSAKVVEKYYDHWIPARQAQLETELQKTWDSRLVRVK
jgi:integrase